MVDLSLSIFCNNWWIGFSKKLPNWGSSNYSGSTGDCILLAACEAHETLPQSEEFPADVFTSCLTTPIPMALRW